MLSALTFCMFAAAILVSMLGQGGGVLYTPIQVWLGIGFHEAATTSLFLIMAMSLSSSLVYRKANRIDWPLVMSFESASVLGGFIGGVFSDFLSGEVLLVLFALTLALGACFMVASPRRRDVWPRRRRRWFVWERRLGEREYRVNMPVGLSGSYVAGMLSGLLGVGGGIFYVPMMAILFGIPVDVAIGSSAVMVGLTAVGGLAGHLVQGHWNWRLSLLLAAAVFLGAQLGSRLSVKMENRRLKAFVGWFLLAVAVLMTLKAVPAG